MNARACVEAGAAFLVADADVEGGQFTDYLRTFAEDEGAPPAHGGLPRLQRRPAMRLGRSLM